MTDPAEPDEELPTSTDGILGRLIATRAQLGVVDQRRDDILELRRRLFTAGRDLTPPVSYQTLGQAAGVSDTAVKKSMNRGTPA